MISLLFSILFCVKFVFFLLSLAVIDAFAPEDFILLMIVAADSPSPNLTLKLAVPLLTPVRLS